MERKVWQTTSSSNRRTVAAAPRVLRLEPRDSRLARVAANVARRCDVDGGDVHEGERGRGALPHGWVALVEDYNRDTCAFHASFAFFFFVEGGLEAQQRPFSRGESIPDLLGVLVEPALLRNAAGMAKRQTGLSENGGG